MFIKTVNEIDTFYCNIRIQNTITLLALNIQNAFHQKHANTFNICTKEIICNKSYILSEAVDGIEFLHLT